MHAHNIVVAPATINDIPAIGPLMEEMWQLHGEQARLADFEKIAGLTAQGYLQRLLADDKVGVFTARIGDEVVGTVSCTIQELPDFYTEKLGLYIDDLSVAASFRHSGVASRLLAACEDFAHARGIIVMFAKIWSFNQKSAALFTKNAFRADYTYYHKILP